MENTEPKDLLVAGDCLRGRWTITRRIGGGGFGQVYEAQDRIDRHRVAVKVERRHAAKPVLRMEVTLLKRLQGCRYVCAFLGCGRTELVNYIVMQMQGPNLSELRRAQEDQKFSPSTSLRLIYEALQCIVAVHAEGFLHRDIKPSNFAIGSTKDTVRKVYILDFGLARQYVDMDGDLRPERPYVGFRGTVRYASLNAHMRKELGRHDDLISLFYMAVEFLTGELPWRKIKEKERVASMKKLWSPSSLLKNDYSELERVFHYVSGLDYHTKPDYSFIQCLLCCCMLSKGIRPEDPFDWEADGSKACSYSSQGGGGESVINNRFHSTRPRSCCADAATPLQHGVADLSQLGVSSDEWAPLAM